MAIKTILTEPNKILRQISKPVVSVGKEEQSLMKVTFCYYGLTSKMLPAKV